VVTYNGLTEGTYTFAVQSQDAVGNTSSVSSVFIVAPAVIPPPDVTPPRINIIESPGESSFVAVGSNIAFSWDGFDSLGSGQNLVYQYSFAGVTSDWVPTRTVTFSGVAAANPARFTVLAKDLAGNISAQASIVFFIKIASVLYVDDYLWLDSFGNPDLAKEREQKAFYREALRGYAFAEWDNDARGAVPTIADLAGFTTVIWAADANVCSADPNYRLWYDIGAEGGGPLKTFMDAGGHLLITGSSVLDYVFNSNPPAATDFESAYLGVSDTMVIDAIDTTWYLGGVAYDTLVVHPDSVTADTTLAPTWQSSTDFTWAIKDEAQGADYPDSMKIDVAKNGNQLACNSSLIYLLRGVQPIFRVGLDVDAGEPDDYGMVAGWIYAPTGHAMSASLIFDTFSMPVLGIRQTFHSILTQFGEGPGL
jgi:hypothetical protein